MKILHLACLNNDPEIPPNMDPKCNPVGGEPHIVTITSSKILMHPQRCPYRGNASALWALTGVNNNID